MITVTLKSMFERKDATDTTPILLTMPTANHVDKLTEVSRVAIIFICKSLLLSDVSLNKLHILHQIRITTRQV